jgi:peptidoglycan/xylan/chitin deacetylase (PgdA/CDA1 family)
VVIEQRKDATVDPDAQGVAMIAISRAPRQLIVAVLTTAMLMSVLPASVAAADFSVRLESAKHVGYTFDSAGKVTGSKAITLSKPATVSASARKAIPTQGIHLRISSGSLAGYWVRESRLAYRPGLAAIKTYSPLASVRLVAGKWETYQFNSSWSFLSARGRTLSTATTITVDRTAVIDGRRYVRVAEGTWAGSWVPGSVTAPQRILCQVGTKPTGTAGRIVRSVPTATGRIALTFDMGGRMTPAKSIMQLLILERVCATIFPTGTAAQTTEGREVMALIKAHPELFEVANHTMNHCNLRDGGGGSKCPTTRPTDAFVAKELADAESVIMNLTGRSSKPYWRPPYGAVDTRLVNAAAAAGYPYAMMWSIDTIDWRPVADGGPTAWQMTTKVRTNATPGAVVLMHLGGYNTRDALPAMITYLLWDGLRPTTISGLYR